MARRDSTLPTMNPNEYVRTVQQQRYASQTPINPAYGYSFDPNDYAPVSADPSLADPLPTGRYIDPAFPSPLNTARMAQQREFLDDPMKYVTSRASVLGMEQSLLDKGKSVLSSIFDYRDDSDLQVFGINMSAVESVWDTVLSRVVGGYDLLNVGFGGLISAMPGGVQTLSFPQLTGGLDVGSVLSGKMEPGMAPSPGQIALTSVALEAKRIREGGARLSDVLLANPATAPFIVAALAAESSPLQQDGFNLMNKAQREQAFGTGWEKWMSGITDAGLAFADPLIGAGVVMKVARAGMLGARSTVVYGRQFGVVADEAVDIATSHLDDFRSTQQIYDDAATVAEEWNKAALIPGGTVRAVMRGNPMERPQFNFPVIKQGTPMPESNNPLVSVFWKIAEVDDAGNKVMTPARIAQMPEVKALTYRADVADILHSAPDIMSVSLVWQAVSGTPEAWKKLSTLAPALSDDVFRFERTRLAMLQRTEPAKLKEAEDMLAKVVENTNDQLSHVDEQLRILQSKVKVSDELSVEQAAEEARATFLRNPNSEDAIQYMRLEEQRRILMQNRDEALELVEVSRGKVIDKLDPNSPWYDADEAARIAADMHRRQDVVTRALNKDIFDAAVEARIKLPYRDTAYARAVTASRERRGRAAYEYTMEGTSILPRKRLVENVEGVQKWESTGWFASSMFEGTSRWQRNARVWRWLGEETPSGYIGLKGTATVGSEREFMAATDLDIYRGDAIIVTKSSFDEAGNLVPGKPVEVGGRARREEFFQRFYAALNSSDVDAQKTLNQIEYDIMSDYAKVYDLDEKAFGDLLTIANKHRAKTLDLIKREAYFIDPDDGTRHFVPYLDSQLANGTYMQNFQELERLLKLHAAKLKSHQLREAFDVPAHFAMSGYDLFNSFWRPLVLMRASYTQRNVFEGMLRAMAYSASLAPLTWPVRATANGIRNKIVARSVSKATKKAQAALSTGEYARYFNEFQAATDDYGRLMAAVEHTGIDDVEPMFHVFDKRAGREAVYKKLSRDQYEKAVDEAFQRMAYAENALRDNASKFDDVVKGTEFGKWRDKQIADLTAEQARLQAFINNFADMADTPNYRGEPYRLEDDLSTISKMAEVTAEVAVVQKQLNTLRYNPALALGEYRTIAGRQRRIGSGTSIGPDGNYYNDAFTGPLDQLNRSLLSADNTVKQSLSLRADVWNSMFQRIMVRSNQAIPWTPGREDEWIAGMVDVIEDLSASRLVQRLVNNDFDIDDAVRWMMQDPDGRVFSARVRSLYGGDPGNPYTLQDAAEIEQFAAKMADNPVYLSSPGGKSTRIKPFTENVDGPTGDRLVIFDQDQARLYALDVANKVQAQMQGYNAFMDLLRKRIVEKQSGSTRIPRHKTASRDNFAAGRGGGIRKADEEDVRAALNSLTDEQRANLGYVQGAEIIRTGNENWLNLWSKFTNSAFKFLGTIPEDAVTRGPFYAMRFKATRNELIRSYWARNGMNVDKSGRVRGATGHRMGQTLEHDSFRIPTNELNRIMEQAHRRALADTREWMYTIERRTNLGKYGEWIYPFISATQNAATVGGKLLWKEPWLAPLIVDLWSMPGRAGFEDDQGNLVMPMPFPFVKDFLKDKPWIPVFGGVVSDQDTILIPKNAFNVFMPETGYGMVPTPSPLVQIGASEMMKAGLFPVETPAMFKSAFGDNADDMYNELKKYIFGEQSAMSSTLLSLDKIVPAQYQRIWNAGSLPLSDSMTNEYGFQFQTRMDTEMARWRAGERDTKPTVEEINQRTTNMFWFNFLGNAGIPTPLTPYPVLARPQVTNKPIDLLQEAYRKYQETDPVNASALFSRDFGDWALEAALTKVTKNVGGAAPNATAVSDIQTLAPLLERASSIVGDDLSLLGILTNNRIGQSEYDPNAYEWQKYESIPGLGDKWRTTQSPQQAMMERQRVAGWTLYRQFMDQLDARLENAGLAHYELMAAAPFKQAKEQFLWNMMNNPEYEGWLIDYQDRSGDRSTAAVRVMQEAVNDPTFQSLLMDNGKERTLGAMQEYLYYRDLTIQAVQESGMGIDAQENAIIKESWLAIRQRLKNSDVRFKEIADMYLASDETPAEIGSFATTAQMGAY